MKMDRWIVVLLLPLIASTVDASDAQVQDEEAALAALQAAADEFFASGDVQVLVEARQLAGPGDIGHVCIYGLPSIDANRIQPPTVSEFRQGNMRIPVGPSIVIGHDGDSSSDSTLMVRQLRVVMGPNPCSSSYDRNLGHIFIENEGIAIDARGWQAWLAGA